MVLLDIFACANIATGCECQDRTSSSYGHNPRMKRSTNEVPDKLSTAKRSATPNHIRVHKTLRLRSRMINPSSKIGSVTVRSVRRLSRVMRWDHLLGSI